MSMAYTREYLTAIDVGTTKVVTLVAKMDYATTEILASGHSPSRGMRKGLIVNPEAMTVCISKSALDAEAMLGHKLPPAFVGITGSHLTSLNAAGTITREPGRHGSQPFSQNDIDELLKSTLPSDMANKRLVQVVPRSFKVDGLDSVTDPMGMHGGQLSAESHVVMGDPEMMETLSATLRSAGIDVADLVLEHLASAEAVLTSEERLMGVVLADIGGGTTDVAVFENGTVNFTRSIPIAGHHFTSDLATGLGISPSAAEWAKLTKADLEVDSINQRESLTLDIGEGKEAPVSRRVFNRLLRDRALDLVRMFLYRLAESGMRRIPSGGIVLTGGSAALPGLADLFAEYGKCSVRIGKPAQQLGLPEEFEDSIYSTAVGLLLWGMRHKPTGAMASSKSTQSESRGWFSRGKSRKARV